MPPQSLRLNGKPYILLPQQEYNRLLLRRESTRHALALPELPKPNSDGTFPAIPALRVGLARKLIRLRWTAGLTQVELARRAGIRPETLNRIEKGKISPSAAMVDRLVRILSKSNPDR